MTTAQRSMDRVEEFTAAVDSYEPTQLERHADNFRVFTRFVSRSLDARYLERHAPEELIPDLEFLMGAGLVRQPGEIKVRLTLRPDGGGQRGVLAAIMPDHLFGLSTVMLSLENLGLERIRYLANAVPIRRSVTGEISAVGPADADLEAFVWVEVEGPDLESRTAAIEDGVRQRLEAVQAAVQDFPQIRKTVMALVRRINALANSRPDQRVAHEGNARFLEWLLDENFVFLGTRFLPSPGSEPADRMLNLGFGGFDDWRGIQIEDAERAVHEAGGIPPYLWIRKSKTESFVYRAGPLDHVLVQCWDEAGGPSGLLVIEGLFSFQALAQARTDIPLLDRVIAQLFTELQASKGTHRYRTIRNAFNSLPLEYLFTLQTADVRQLIEQLLEVDAEHRVQTHITTDELQSFAFIFVAVPRSHYTEELRIEVRRLLKRRFRASSADDGVYAGDPASVTFHYFLTGVTSLSPEEQSQLQVEIEQLASPWADRLQDELMARYEPREARRLHGLYSEAFPVRYREETSIGRAVTDIELLEHVAATGQFDCDLYRETPDKRLGITRLRMVQVEPLLLSDILPALDNLGLVIMDEFPTTVHVPGQHERVISTFRVRGGPDMDVDLMTRRNRLRAGIRAIVTGALDDDPLNRLLLRADIPWTYVALLRAYQHYARQIGVPYTAGKIQDALEQNASVVRALTELFRAKFDPGVEGQSAYAVDDRRRSLVERTRRALLTLLDGVDDLVSDQVLRTLYHLVEATVRTNFYARDPMTSPEVVLKLDPSLIPRMPPPTPFREIYVHHPQMAGLHLRGGPVARGGIRWSDRLLDFRTEVLSLMATQNLKNVVIVPRGAKGSFVLRKSKRETGTRREEADAMYRVFIHGLLSVTDNLVDGKVVHPSGVLCYDGPDHYLVVAADKGTAHLSDTANEVAAKHQFWLGDAFASGGSHGYDHKKEAITARGAWECVRRHFREIGKDPEKDRIRVVGIGDMSGDVFGNGMLLSKSMQLVAAFDHRHIFVDPNPDPERSHALRRMLFEKPRSSWQDYPADELSKGGGVYPRSAKSIDLSPEVREVLGIAEERLSGEDLIKAILRAPVDLLWNGGIGTYIKSEAESHLEVGDASNDAVRVDGSEVRARVIGEGGNLGITALGRVELARRGVRLNTDAVDNSAGVDLSDHEVNLKILLRRPMDRGVIDFAQRNAILDQVRVQVCSLVLDNNWVQSRMLSLDVLRSRRDLQRFIRSIDFLSDRVPFNRREMHLPGSRALSQRLDAGEGLYRPELASLAANAKLDMSQELTKAPSFDLERLSEYLLSYFPPSIVERFRDDVLQHPLGIDIARTVLINRVIGDAGASWLPELSLRTGRRTSDILVAHLKACELLEADNLKGLVDDAPVAADDEYAARLIIEDAVENVTLWLLREEARVDDALTRQLRTALGTLEENVTPEDRSSLADRTDELVAAGFERALAERLTALERIEEAVDMAVLAATSGAPLQQAARMFYAVGAGSGVLELIRTAGQGNSSESLDIPARAALRDRLRRYLVRLTRDLIRLEGEAREPGEEGQRYIRALHKELVPLSNGKHDLSSLVIAVDRVDRHTRFLEQQL